MKKQPHAGFLVFQSFLGNLLQAQSVSASSLWLDVNQEDFWDWLEPLPRDNTWNYKLEMFVAV